ncbi:MAG: zinc-ribbon and DUF3426 domain-containing protein [Comamonas sp.]|nr:zinc-ribbon and DUF3426 domain-containing protein [Candidatus Comamonas equi]
MSLITRCPSCATQFRVVADQLRISEGWVRCGRCQEVFDATQALQEGAAPAAVAPVVTPPAAAPEPVAPASKAPAPAFAPASEPAPEVPAQPATAQPQTAGMALANTFPAAAPMADAEVAQPGYELPAPPEPAAHDDALWQWDAEEVPPEMPSQPQPHLASASEDAWLSTPLREALVPRVPSTPAWDAQPQMPEFLAPPRDAAPAPTPAWAPVKAVPAEDEQALQWAQALSAASAAAAANDAVQSSATQAQAEADDDAAMHASDAAQDVAEPVPTFVKQAQRKAWWSQPAVRFVMGMLVTLLPLALLLQIAVHERNQLVAWKPQWRPAFAAMCVALRCELAPRQHIASVVLTGSSFNQDVQPYHYRLGLSIQNQSGASVATPAVELTLTDTQGQTLVRKVLLPAEIGAPVELAARSEWTGSLPVATQGLQLPVSGYRVLAFYP